MTKHKSKRPLSVLNVPAFASATAYLNIAVHALGQASQRLGRGHIDTKGLKAVHQDCISAETLAMRLRDRVLKLEGQG